MYFESCSYGPFPRMEEVTETGLMVLPRFLLKILKIMGGKELPHTEMGSSQGPRLGQRKCMLNK